MKRYVGLVVAAMLLGAGSAWAVPAQKAPGVKTEASVKVLGHEVMKVEANNKNRMNNVHNETKLDGAHISNSGELDLGVVENKNGGEMRDVSNELEFGGRIINEGKGGTRVGNSYN